MIQNLRKDDAPARLSGEFIRLRKLERSVVVGFVFFNTSPSPASQVNTIIEQC